MTNIFFLFLLVLLCTETAINAHHYQAQLTSIAHALLLLCVQTILYEMEIPCHTHHIQCHHVQQGPCQMGPLMHFSCSHLCCHNCYFAHPCLSPCGVVMWVPLVVVPLLIAPQAPVVHCLPCFFRPPCFSSCHHPGSNHRRRHH